MTNVQKAVHFILQGKGGVGKSFVAALIAQYLASQKAPLACYDTDPVNATLLGYQSLGARRLELMAEGSTTLDERRFDELMEQVVHEDTNFVIDNGAASFIPLSNYLIENSAIEVIQNAGKQVVLHTVVTGGQAMMDTLRGFAQLASQMPEHARLVVWLNEYFGDVRGTGKDDAGNEVVRNFEEMKAYRDNAHRVDAIIRIPRQTSSTFGKDVEEMLHAKLTFDDVARNEKFSMMAKSRLQTVRKAIFDQLTAHL